MIVHGVKVDEVAAQRILLLSLSFAPVVARGLEGALVRNRICEYGIAMRAADRLLRKNAKAGIIRWNSKERTWTRAS